MNKVWLVFDVIRLGIVASSTMETITSSRHGRKSHNCTSRVCVVKRIEHTQKDTHLELFACAWQEANMNEPDRESNQIRVKLLAD